MSVAILLIYHHILTASRSNMTLPVGNTASELSVSFHEDMLKEYGSALFPTLVIGRHERSIPGKPETVTLNACGETRTTAKVGRRTTCRRSSSIAQNLKEFCDIYHLTRSALISLSCATYYFVDLLDGSLG